MESKRIKVILNIDLNQDFRKKLAYSNADDKVTIISILKCINEPNICGETDYKNFKLKESLNIALLKNIAIFYKYFKKGNEDTYIFIDINNLERRKK